MQSLILYRRRFSTVKHHNIIWIMYCIISTLSAWYKSWWHLQCRWSDIAKCSFCHLAPAICNSLHTTTGMPIINIIQSKLKTHAEFPQVGEKIQCFQGPILYNVWHFWTASAVSDTCNTVNTKPLSHVANSCLHSKMALCLQTYNGKPMVSLKEK